jgi:hypothetical protein
MEYRSRLQWFILVLVTIAIIVGVGFGIASLIRRITGSGGNDTVKTTSTAIDLDDYSNDNSSVSFIIDGPVQANETHKQVKITINQSVRVVEVLSGYEGKVEKTQSFTNNLEAYETFLKALQTTNFLKENSKIDEPDERGACATGYRYIYTLKDSGTEVKRLWTTSCGSKTGTALTPYGKIKPLFEKQIPDYNKFISGIKI